jgi:hypothetical protein
LVKTIAHIVKKIKPLIIILTVLYIATTLSLYLLLGNRNRRKEMGEACRELKATIHEIPDD